MVSLLNRRRTAIEWVALFLLSLGLVALLVVTRVADRADNLVYDALSRAVPRPASNALVIVAIDNASLTQIGRWPWSRSVHAQALERLAEARPRAVLYDILFVEPAPGDDARLADAMAKARPVFLPLLLQAPGANGASFDEKLPVPPLANAMAGAGQVIARPDDDGVVRRARIETVIGMRCWQHLALVTAHALTGTATTPCGRGPAEGLVPYAGPAGRYPTVPFSAVLKGEVPAELLAGKIVLVGASASGLGDQYATPMQSRRDLMSGVEFQANLLDALLGSGLRTETGTAWTLVYSFVPLVILWIGFLYLPPRSNLLLAALLLSLLLLFSGWLLIEHALWIRPAPAIIVMALFLPIWGWRRLAAASRYFVTELNRLREEPGILGMAAPSVAAADRLELQMNLLRDAVRQVRELKHFIEQSQASLPDATLVTDARGIIALANDRAQQFWEHYALRRAQGSLPPLLQALRPHITDGLAEFDALIDSMGDGTATEQECEIDLVDGGAYLLRIKPCFDVDGSFSFGIIRLTDISELRATARQRDTMLQFLTHDMRSPQTSILALLANANETDIAGDLSWRIAGHARQTLDLAEEFVQIARAEAADYEMELLDLRDVAVEAADQLWAQAQARGMKILLEADKDELLVRGNASLLARAVANLVSNAVKYGEADGEVRIRTSVDDAGRAICTVEDDGRGMSPEQVARLFERFSRFVPANAEEAGIGLGLVLVRTVAAGHGGVIECASEPGKGSRFTLRLSRAES